MEKIIKVSWEHFESSRTVGSVKDPNLGCPGELLYPHEGTKSI